MAHDESRRVLIIGAGATGLLIAQGLKKAGIPVEVFEKQPFDKYQDRAGVWGMALHWSTYNVEACLPPEIFAHLKNAQTDPFTEVSDQFSKTIPMYNGKTGDLITHVEAEGPMRVHRGRLRDLLRTGLNVRFGKELHTFSVENSTVIASFNGGKEVWKGSYLVGADGPRSKVRSSTVPEGESQPRQLSYFQIHPVATLAPHPEQKTYFFMTVGDIKDPDHPELWIFQISLSYWTDADYPASQEERMRLFKKLGSHYCEPFKTVADWVNPDTHLPIDHFGSWTKIQPWNNFGGRVILAGDAAHPMVPYRAQGLNNALEDAGLCVRTLVEVINEGKDLAQAIAAYDADVFGRGKSEISLSNTQMHACHHWDTLMGSKLVHDGFSRR